MCGCGNKPTPNPTGNTVYSNNSESSAQPCCCPTLPCVEPVAPVLPECRCPSYKDKYRFQQCCPPSCAPRC